MVAEARAAARSEISFEVYVKRQGRWIIEAVLAEREQAFKLAEGLTAGKDVAAVRVVRECFDQSSGESVERVIFDSDIRLEKPAPARPEPPAPKRRHEPEPEIRPRAERPEELRAFPWLALSSITCGLALAALGFWFIGALG